MAMLEPEDFTPEELVAAAPPVAVEPAPKPAPKRCDLCATYAEGEPCSACAGTGTRLNLTEFLAVLPVCQRCGERYLPGKPAGWKRLVPRCDPGLCPVCTAARYTAELKAGRLKINDLVGPGSIEDLTEKFLGYRLTPVSDEESAAFRDRIEQGTSARAKPVRGVPAVYAGVDFARAQPWAAIEITALYLQDDHPNGRALWLCGPNEVGKSYAAACALAHVDHQEREWFSVPEMARRCAFVAQHNISLRERVLETTFVVLDEWVIFPDNSREAGWLEEVLATRCDNRRPTIITSNVHAEELRPKLSDRVLRRLRTWLRNGALSNVSSLEPLR